MMNFLQSSRLHDHSSNVTLEYVRYSPAYGDVSQMLYIFALLNKSFYYRMRDSHVTCVVPSSSQPACKYNVNTSVTTSAADDRRYTSMHQLQRHQPVSRAAAAVAS